MFRSKSDQLMNGSFRMHPAKGMKKNIELAGIIADYGQIFIISTREKKQDRSIKLTSATDPQSRVVCPVHRLPELNSQIVTKARSALWNEYIERYHSLGHKPLPGAQLRYFITAGEQIIALAGFGATAWQTAPRDHFIGWTLYARRP